MKREGQIWLTFFGLLFFGIPLLMSFCAVVTGKVDDERTKATAAEKTDVAEPATSDLREERD